jgi:1,2-diacylglycerol 3-beta-galactosyltransferase
MRILILMTKAGGGHSTSAEALKLAFCDQYGAKYQVDIIDLWMDHTRWPVSQIPKTYPLAVDETPRLYEFVYRACERPPVMRQIMKVMWRWTRAPIGQAIEKYSPDLIVSVHPLLQEFPLRILAESEQPTPFVTVVTDLISIHPTWFHKKVSLCFVASDDAYRLAVSAGLEPGQVRQFGLPIRPAFAREARPREVVRRTLGLSPELPTALLVGGGQGMGPVADIAQAVAAHLASARGPSGTAAGHLVVICGRNHKLEDRLRDYSWPAPTTVMGFVDNMWEWMGASDCVITKAGSGTIAEALALGRPILLSGHIPGQEDGNVSYVVENGVGAYSRDPQQIAEIAGRWLGSDQDRLNEMAARARGLGRPRASMRIVQEIDGLLD